MDKDTFFNKNTLNCRGKIINIDSPLIMGILNVSPDSFFDGGYYCTEKELINHVKKMLSEGASIIDIGAMSTRPGSKETPLTEEKQKISETLKIIRKEFPDVLISIDTYRSEVALKSIEYGADIINDISGGEFDSKTFDSISRYNVPYVLMHSRNKPLDMQNDTTYMDLIGDVMKYFSLKTKRLRELGVSDIIIDPGFGFGKSLEQNYIILEKLSIFQLFEAPILVGVSRKSMITKTLNITPEEALNGTSILHGVALQNGAKILRVHDVKEANESIKLIKAYSDKI